MYKSIYKKIALSVISVFIFYSMTTVGGTASYMFDISSDNVKDFIGPINDAKPGLTISSIKAMKGNKRQSDIMNYQLSIDMSSLKMQSLRKPLVIKSLSYDSKGLSKPVKVLFSKNRKAKNNTLPDITINSIQSNRGKLLVEISCSSDVGSHDKVGKKKASKSFGSSRKGSMNKASRQSSSDNLCGLSKNKKLFVTLYQ